jgi:hypothetical protein
MTALASPISSHVMLYDELQHLLDGAHVALQDVEVRSANGRRVDPHDRIRARLKGGVRQGFPRPSGPGPCRRVLSSLNPLYEPGLPAGKVAYCDEASGRVSAVASAEELQVHTQAAVPAGTAHRRKEERR